MIQVTMTMGLSMTFDELWMYAVTDIMGELNTCRF